MRENNIRVLVQKRAIKLLSVVCVSCAHVMVPFFFRAKHAPPRAAKRRLKAVKRRLKAVKRRRLSEGHEAKAEGGARFACAGKRGP